MDHKLIQQLMEEDLFPSAEKEDLAKRKIEIDRREAEAERKRAEEHRLRLEMKKKREEEIRRQRREQGISDQFEQDMTDYDFHITSDFVDYDLESGQSNAIPTENYWVATPEDRSVGIYSASVTPSFATVRELNDWWMRHRDVLLKLEDELAEGTIRWEEYQNKLNDLWNEK